MQTTHLSVSTRNTVATDRATYGYQSIVPVSERMEDIQDAAWAYLNGEPQCIYGNIDGATEMIERINAEAKAFLSTME
jgi:hypothetical protein